jgi:hypothetical protein
MDCHLCRGPDGARWRKEWGCDEPNEHARIFLDDKPLTTCPLNGSIPDDYFDAMRAWNDRQLGVLPCEGGSSDQAEWYRQAMLAISGAIKGAGPLPGDE